MIDPVLYVEINNNFEKVPLRIETLAQYGSGFYVLDCGFNVIIYNHIADEHHKPLKLHLSQNEDMIYKKSSEIAGPLQFLHTDVFKQERSFTPSIIVTQTDHSQARFFTARLSPRNDSSRDIRAKVDQKRGFWDSLKGFIGKTETTAPYKQYYDVLSDDVSFESFCNDLFNDVQRYSRTASV
jgi:protein transport protein SEC23